MSALHVNVISHIPIKDVSDAVRSLLSADPRSFVDLVNGDSSPLSKGKVVLSGFSLIMAVVALAAKHQGKSLSWSLAATDTWAPLDGISDKVLERALRGYWPNVSGAIPRDISSPRPAGPEQAAHSGSLAVGSQESINPGGKAHAGPSLTAEDVTDLIMPQLLLKTTKRTKDLYQPSPLPWNGSKYRCTHRCDITEHTSECHSTHHRVQTPHNMPQPAKHPINNRSCQTTQPAKQPTHHPTNPTNHTT